MRVLRRLSRRVKLKIPRPTPPPIRPAEHLKPTWFQLVLGVMVLEALQMTFQKKRTPKVKEFVHPPFIACPDCGSDGGFGVLSIGPNQMTRRCIKCWFDETTPLPPIRKKLVYLDQFVVSNMMKGLDPDFVPNRDDPHGEFYDRLFDRLDRLFKLQLAVCSSSPIHHRESVVDNRYRKLQAVYRHFSHGVKFWDPEMIFHRQISRAFTSWREGASEVAPLSRSAVLTGDPDKWCERLRIELNAEMPGLANELRRLLK